MKETIYAGSPRENKAYKEIELIFLQHIENLAADTGDWAEVDEADQDRALTLYRTYKNEGWAKIEDEGDVIDLFLQERQEYLTAKAEEQREFFQESRDEC